MVPVSCFNRKCSYYSRFVLHLCFGQHYRLRFSYCVLRCISPAAFCAAFRQPRFVSRVLPGISPAVFRQPRFAPHFVGRDSPAATYGALRRLCLAPRFFHRAARCFLSTQPPAVNRIPCKKLFVFLSSCFSFYLLASRLLVFLPSLYFISFLCSISFFHLVLFFALLYHSRVIKQ